MIGVVLAVLGGLVHGASHGPQAAQAETSLQSSSLVLVEGICGGIVGPTRHRTVVLGFDWNRRAFRAVEERLELSTWPRRRYRAVDLEAERYERIIARVVEFGLPGLPLEDPPGCTDLYGRNTGIRFSRGGESWENQAPEGCRYGNSAVGISEEQRERFDAVVELVNRTLAELPLEPASALDWWTPRDWQESELCAMSGAVDLLSERGLVGELNANGVEIEGTAGTGHHLRFPWRHAQPFESDYGRPVSPAGACDVRVGPGVGAVELVRVTPLEIEDDEDVARRRAFVEAHAELSRPQRDLILAGWVEGGMSEAQVLAAWGEPISREVVGRETRLEYHRGKTHAKAPLDDRVTLKLIEDRLIWR